MKKESTRILLMELTLVLISLIAFLFMKNFSQFYYSLCFIFPLVLSYKLFGWYKRTEKDSKDVLLTILIYTTSYYLITYLLGYFTGFLKSSYSQNIVGILKNISSYCFWIGIIESIRWIIIKKTKYQNKIVLIGLVLSLTMVEWCTKSTLSSLQSKKEILDYLFQILPILSKNILLTTIMYETSIFNGINYRLIMEIPPFIIPIIPNFGEYLNILISMLFPLGLEKQIQKIITQGKRKNIISRDINKQKKRIQLEKKIIIGLLLISILLVSGKLRYYALTIGSDSMKNTINKGDIVILDKKKENIQEGDIIAYWKDGRIIVHRVVQVIEKKYRTKGDNNTTTDEWTIYPDDIVGKVKIRLKYLGWPTVKLNEWIMDGE